jgi:polyhydroxyalkanoate synthesis regulator phasin
MAVEKSAVYQIKKLINSYFNQEEELTSEGVDNGFLNLLEIILKPSDNGKKIYNDLISRANRQNRKNPDSKIYKDIHSLLYNQMIAQRSKQRRYYFNKIFLIYLKV